MITDRGIEDTEDSEVDDQLDLAEVASCSVVRAAASVCTVASTRPGWVTSVSCWVAQVTRLGRLLPRRPAPSHALVCTQTQPPPPHSSRYTGLLTCPCSRTEHRSLHTQSEISALTVSKGRRHWADVRGVDEIVQGNPDKLGAVVASHGAKPGKIQHYYNSSRHHCCC